MNISGIGSAFSSPYAPAPASSPSTARASDGDSAQVEAAESSATKMAEQANGGFAPAATSAAPAATAGGVNKVV